MTAALNFYKSLSQLIHAEALRGPPEVFHGFELIWFETNHVLVVYRVSIYG